MMENGKMTGSEKIDARLGSGTEFDGKLSFKGTVRIDGKFSGEIKSDGTLVVGEEADLHAEVFVNTLILKGSMTGNVTATNAVELVKTGKLHGNITTPSLSVEKGALFQGQCKMGDAPAGRSVAPPFQAPPEGPKTL